MRQYLHKLQYLAFTTYNTYHYTTYTLYNTCIHTQTYNTHTIYNAYTIYNLHDLHDLHDLQNPRPRIRTEPTLLAFVGYREAKLDPAAGIFSYSHTLLHVIHSALRNT